MKIVCFTRKIIGLVLIAGLFFFSCPLPDSDETGTLIIRLPADSSARSAVPPELIAALKYRIVCEGSGRVSRESAPGDLVSIPLAVGQWKVTVTVLNDKGESIGSKTVEVTIKRGRTTTVPVTIPINTGEGGGTVDVTGVTLSPKSLTLTVGGEPETLTATVAPANADNKNVTWSSGDDDIATVNANGLVTAVAKGEATITVTTADGGFFDTCSVTVLPAGSSIPVTGVTLSSNTLHLALGETATMSATLTATVIPVNADNKNVTWSTSNLLIATVNENGLVTAVTAGTATITVKTEDDGHEAVCVVTVTDPGIVWKNGTTPNSDIIFDYNNNSVAIVYGNGKFVLASGASVNNPVYLLYSEDGETWEKAIDHEGLYYGEFIIEYRSVNLVYGNGKFFYYYNDSSGAGFPHASADGVNWYDDFYSDSIFFSSSTYGNGMFMGVALNYILYSSDGLNWEYMELEGNWRTITYANNKFVAGGDGGKMAYSSDGINWTDVTDSTFGADNSISAIAYGSGKFVAVGGRGKMAYSSDGVNWTDVTDSTFGTTNIMSIAYGGNKFVAGGTNGKMAYSYDGINWIAVADSTFSNENVIGNIRAIAYGSGKFVAVGSNCKIAYSD